jgi:hypothetical protein
MELGPLNFMPALKMQLITDNRLPAPTWDYLMCSSVQTLGETIDK